MHGQIGLESELGRGTKATFSLPLNKPQFTGAQSPLVSLGSLPDRLQSELSVSGCDIRSRSATPPMSPRGNIRRSSHRKGLSGSSINAASPLASETELVDRSLVHILVVEDK